VAALGCATQLVAPKAVVLVGRTAENGKSQTIEIMRGLLPNSAVSSIPLGKLALVQTNVSTGLRLRSLQPTGALLE
jgi:hypothetical protein